MAAFRKWAGRIATWALAAVAAMAATSRTDATANILSYLDSVRPTAWLAAIAVDPRATLVLGLTLGALAFRWYAARTKRPQINQVEALGNELYLMATRLESMRWPGFNHATVADTNVILTKLARRGFAVPSEERPISPPQYARYFHQVGAYLRANDVEAAKQVAVDISKQIDG